MSVLTSKTVINATAEQIFAVLSDPRRIVNFIPGAMRVTNVPRLPLKRGDVVHWEFMLLGMPLRGRWVVEEIVRPFFYIAKTKGGVDGQLTYAIVPRGKSSRVTLTFDYQLPQTLIRRYTLKLIEPHAQSIIDTYLASLKSFLEPAAKK